jgi:hypothetical protein
MCQIQHAKYNLQNTMQYVQRYLFDTNIKILAFLPDPIKMATDDYNTYKLHTLAPSLSTADSRKRLRQKVLLGDVN